MEFRLVTVSSAVNGLSSTDGSTKNPRRSIELHWQAGFPLFRPSEPLCSQISCHSSQFCRPLDPNEQKGIEKLIVNDDCATFRQAQ